jgi:NADH-quinone oxidoreductase subunit I
MTIGIKKVGRPETLSFGEKIYLLEILKGLGVTIGHFFRNAVHQEKIWTMEYPEVRRTMPPRFRGRHRLMKRDDGTSRCVACYCCQTACPARCITIVAGDAKDPAVEKAPVSFDIDMLRCIFCGQCVEACPLDAIRMDTGWFTPVDNNRESLLYSIDRLLEK